MRQSAEAPFDRDALLAAPPEEQITRLLVALRRLVARALRVEERELAADRSLFASGLDSLGAAELQAAIEASLGARLSLADLLQGPTLEELAAGLLAQLTRLPSPAPPVPLLPRRSPVTPEAATRPAPLSQGQRALWLLDRLAPGNPAYVIAGAARLHGGLDLPRLRRALGLLVGRHPSLRTTFQAGGEAAVQVAHEAAAFAFAEEDAAVAGTVELAERLAAAAYGPFDLARGPLLRVTVLHRGAEAPLLVLAVHHIVADFWSLGVLLGELGALWRGEALPPLPLAYSDFVRQESERLAGMEGERLWSWWRSELAPPLPALDLPTDRPRPPLQSLRGGARSLRLPRDLTASLAARGRRAGATPFMTLLAAFLVLLHRLSGQDELRVGTPTAGRSSPGLEGVVGYFVNPVVVRGDLRGDPSFATLLGRVKTAAVAALSHQDLPFPLLAERLGGARDPSRSPLFQAMFVLYRERREGERGLGGFAVGAADVPLNLGGLVLESVPLPRQSSQFDLTLLLAETGGQLAATLQFNRDLFDDTSAERLLAHTFQTLLTAIAGDADGGEGGDIPVSALALLAASERHQMEVEWNAAPWAVGGEDLMQTPFERQAARAPEAIAIIDRDGGTRALSYGELDRRASLLARALAARGVGAERLVGIFCEPSLAMIAGLLAVLKAGGAYLPLDPTLPDERLDQILADGAVAVALTAEGLAARLPATVPRLRLDDRPEVDAAPGTAADQASRTRPDNAAYMLYTSGSTGQPKGVVVSHRAVVNRLRFQVAADLAPMAGSTARVLQRTRLGFDVSVLEIFAPLWIGASVVLTAAEGQQDPVQLVRSIAEQQVTNVTLPPALFPALLADATFRGAVSLRLVVTGADRVPGDLPRRFFAAFAGGTDPAPRLTARYGPTEATIAVSEWSCRPDSGGQSVPLGRPIAGARFYLLDRQQRAVPPGVPGELCVAGICLARGYLARPDLTAAAFLPDPFARSAAAAGGRLYRTGDLARYRADGVVEFLGRVDRQVKIRGFRLELGEVEAALARHPAVTAAVVVDRDEPATGGRRLVAYVVARPGADPAGRDGIAGMAGRWRDFLAGQLPAYMVPAAFVLLEQLPRNANGKLDRTALPEPRSDAAAEADLAPPRDPWEELLAALWAQLLGVERVGIHQDFFALGGHSLLATQLVTRVRQALGVELAVREIFAAPTVAGLAARLAAVQNAPDRGVPPPLLPAPAEAGPAPLSFAQERLWLLAQIEPGSPAYHIPMAVLLSGRLAVPALAASLSAVVRRQAALRTGIAVLGERAVQRALPARPVPLPVADLRALPAAVRAAEVTHLARGAARLPFDLATGPLLRARLLALGPREHALLLTVHHIAWDGWSTGIFLRELAALYGGDLADLAAAGEPRLQYSDYARWQRAWLTDERLAGSLAYWRSRLAGAPTAIELPTDRPRPAVLGTRGGEQPLNVDADLLAALGRLGRELGATLFMVLTATLNLLLHRLTGQDDLLLGFPIANRTAVETEEMIGVFVNTLVLRSTLAPEASFAALVAHTREATLAAYEHQDLPFERLVAELAPERSLSRAPLFQVLLALQNTPAAPLSLPGLVLTPLAIDSGIARFDLALSLAPRPGPGTGLEGRLELHRDLFDATTAGRWAACYQTLLAAAVRDPRSATAHLPLLSAAQRHQLREWNGTGVPYPLDRCLHEWIEEQVRRTPEAVAVAAGGESLTYGALNARANRLARQLRERGVGPETVVAIRVERSAALVVGLLATLKAGGAYLPLDPDDPPERQRFMRRDARARLLLTADRLAAGLGEEPGGYLGQNAGSDLGIPVSPESLAYVIYTSGTTGKPKGVMNRHRGIVNRLLWMQERYGLRPDDRVLQKTPVTFDVSVWELFWPLLTGARLVMARPGGHRDTAYLWRTIAERGITTLHFVPSMLRAFLDDADLPDRSGRLPLCRVLASGEALSPDLERRFHATLTAPLHNLYGPTEAAVDVTSWACDRAAPRPLVPIGRPLANTAIHLLDRHGEEVPTGAPGELHIGGVQVARGYLGRPDLTAWRFVPDPTAAAPGERLYRTGDLARYLADGAIDYLGRNDDQVKIRGFRIELGEIEAGLRALPVVQAAAVAVRGGPGGPRLVAYVVPREQGALPPTLAGLRRELARRLPEFMLPAGLVLLDRLPLTASGKLDRRALPEPETPAASESAGRGVLRTPAEELLAGIWVELLGVERVGGEDNFFALGGHSLLATRVISRLRQLFAVELTLRDLFEAPTVRGLAARVVAARGAGRTPLPPLAPMAPRSRAGRLPLSFAQERLWFLDQLEPGSAAYNLPAALRLAGPLLPAVLAGALGEVARRHESLRTTFAVEAGEPRQEIQPVGRWPLPRIDLGALGGPAREGEAGRLAWEEARRPFALATGPLLRTSLLILDDVEHLLLATLHHIAGDGWSIGVLTRELGTLYTAVVRGVAAALPELPIQYADFAAWQRQWLDGPVLQEQLCFWRRTLAAAPPLLALPADRPRPAERSGRGAGWRFRLSAAPTTPIARLETLGRRLGTTLFMTLLALFKILLGRYTGQDTIVVGTPVAGRTQSEMEGLIGCFVNTLVLCTELGGEPGFAPLLGRVRESVLAAHAHQELPFEKLVEELAPERGLDRSPLFQVMFALHDEPPVVLELPGVAAAPLPIAAERAQFDLSLTLERGDQGLAGTLQYATDLFDRVTIGRLAGHFEVLLEGVVADPACRGEELALLTVAERHQLAMEWNESAPAGLGPKSARSIVQEIEAQVERTPEATAVVGADGRLTYRQLNAAANRLAHRLRALGVGPEVPVGLCLERSLDLASGILAIWKAGGAFVPIEPTYPAERQAYLVADSGAPLVVTRQRWTADLPAGVRQLCLDVDGQDEAAAASAARGEDNPVCPSGPENLAYLIYTSGSTGRPKAVPVEHGSLANLLLALRQELDWNAADVVPCLAPFSFDIFLFELLGPWLAGGTAMLVPLQPALDLPALLELLPRSTRLHGVPALLRQIVDALDPAAGEAPRPSRHPRLRTVFCGGDRVPARLRADLLRVFPGAEIRVLYGPTESTILAAGYPQPRSGEGVGSPIGRPLGNAVLAVHDRHGQAVPIGVAGELAIGGPGVARGYLHRPELTAERYVPAPAGRLYRSGDLVRYRPDGNLEFLGRTDGQVKIRGFRVEPGEVEAALLTHAAVRAAVVVAREDLPGDRRLVAYVVGEAPADELRRHLRRSLPEHLVPAAFVGLDALPLSAHGKVDRRRLPAPPREAGKPGETGAPPRSWAEEIVAAIWADVLGLTRIDREASFFDLGGHSLLATRVISRLRAACGVELPLRELFAAPTVAGLAARVERARATGGRRPEPPLVPLAPVVRERPLPLSFAQQRLWFLDQLAPGSALYNVPAALRFTGRLAAAVLAGCLAETVRRHEALRTRFAVVDGEPVQVIENAWRLPFARVDLAGLAAAAREGEARRLAASEARRPFDLGRAPQLRATLLALGEEEHVLLLTLHHIASDGWSMAVLVREVAALYGAALAGRPSPLPELQLQYADFACWQRNWLAGEVLAEQIAYWRERLAGATGAGALELPTDRARPKVADFRGARLQLRLPDELAAALAAVGRREGVTLFMVLLGAFQALLGRYSGQRRPVVGSPIANRNRREIEGLIGFFVNTLALAGDLTGDPSWRELLGRTRESCLGAYAHQDLPFEKLVLELLPERDLARNPLFQVMLALQNAPREEVALPGLAVAPFELPAETARFDLTLTVVSEVAEGEGLTAFLTYPRALFDATTGGRLLGYFVRLLAGLAAAPEERVWEVPLLAAAETAQLVREWNDTARRGAGAPRVLHELFAAQAARTPGAPAVRSEGECLSYRELDRQAALLAHRLRREGVGPEVAVGLLVEPCLAAIVGLLAVLKAGGAYVPLDPGAPAERLAAMVEDAGIAVVLARGERLAPAGVRRVDLASAAESLPMPAGGELSPVAVAAENLAYVLYTSGSSGRPKGVAVPHGAVVNYTLAIAERLGLAPGAHFAPHFAMVQPLTVDSCVTAIFPPLLCGGCLHVLPRERALVAPALAEAFRRYPIDGLKIAPSHLAALVAAGESAALLPRRWLIVGGEPSPIAWLRRLQAAAPRCAVFNHYGPTEATVGMLLYRVGEEEGASFSPVTPVGRPLANTEAYLLDEHLRPVPLGSRGTLYIGGACVARGYLGRPELTAERFVPDPWSARPGARLYDSGDLMRHTARGDLVFLGRHDQQIKIRGFRVELGEVEAALSRHPGIGEVVVRTWEEAPGREGLAAYVVGRGGGAAPALAELRPFLAAKLPDYMLPSAVVPLPALPRTPHGKLDLHALPAPLPAAVTAGEPELAPRTPTQELLAGVYGDLLGCDRVGTADGFFDLGGHSLLATRLLSRLRDLFGVELSLREVFEQPTVAGLARRIEAAGRRRSGREAPPIERLPRRGELPPSFAQQRLWFLAQLAPGSPRYHIPLALALRGRLDVPALARSLGEVVRRHEVLRTRFTAVAGQPMQVISPWSPPVLPLIDLGGLPPERRESAASGLATAEARRPFDLATGPLLRSTLLGLGGEEHRALLTLHHIASDAWSKEILAREVGELYRAFSAGRPSPLPELAVQYADFAVWQRNWLTGEVLAAEAAHWRGVLAGAPPLLALPLDRPRPAVWSDRGASCPLALPAAASAGVARLAREGGATSFMVLLAALLALLSRTTGQLDLSLGTPIAGRTHREVEPLIGFFVNTLVLRADLSGAPGFAALLARVREMALAAYLHQDLPFDKLVEELQPQRSLAYSPLFQAMFVLQNAPAGKLTLPGLSLSPLRVEPASAKFDLTLALTETPAGLSGAWEYSPDLFDGATMRRLSAAFERLLGAALRDPLASVAQLPLLSAGERHQLLVEWNDTDGDGSGPQALHALFEAQCERCPEAPAVVAAGGELSYGELEARANRLAWYLRSRGVGPEVRVGLLLARSPERVVALLAILKAGGAYVPLEPAYPAERLAFLLADSAAALLLTEESLAGRVPAGGAAVVCLDRERASIAQQPAYRGGAGAGGDSLAYVIYTSGSTGRPKGVAVRHRGVCRVIASSLPLLGLGGATPGRLLHLGSLGFDVSALEIFTALASGASLHLLEEETRHALADLAPRLRAERITTLILPPSQLQVVPLRDLPELRTVMVGGETCPPEVAARWAPGRTFWNAYGPTEVSIFATVARCSGEEETTVPLGRPLPGVRIRLLGPGLEPVPLGVLGEIHIAGGGLARGYCGRPEQTAERFVPDPWAASPGERMYRTGDLGRHLPDGRLEFAGRGDEQVKIRGFRIEPGEIEAALAACGGVREAAVVAREDLAGGRGLVAFVVPETADGIAAAALQELLRRRLPDPMVPAHVVFLDALPLTPHGKIDRRELARTRLATEGLAVAPYAAPRTPLELLLARLWEELLERAPVGIRESFFEIGGHSLLAVRLVARLRAALGGREVSLADLFQAPTVEQLARQLTKGGAAIGSPLVPLQPRGTREPFFCVHPIGGGVVRYFAPLVERLGADQPFYALEAADLARQGASPHPTIEEMAARYVAALREVRPHGPYRLGGASYGGIVAFEMARQLTLRGEEVALLALFDTVLPDAASALPLDRALFSAEMAHMLARQEGATLDLTAGELRGLAGDEMLTRVLDRLRAAGLVGREIDLPWMRRYLAGFESRRAAALAYQPRFYPGEIELFRVSRAPAGAPGRRSIDDPALGWGELAEEVRIHPVPGTHETMLQEPHVRELASLLASCMERPWLGVVPEAGVEPVSPRGAVDVESTAPAGGVKVQGPKIEKADHDGSV